MATAVARPDASAALVCVQNCVTTKLDLVIHEDSEDDEEGGAQGEGERDEEYDGRGVATAAPTRTSGRARKPVSYVESNEDDD